MQGHGGLITSIIHEKSNEHIQKVARHPSVWHWALIIVCLFGIWIMNKHCGEMATINLSLGPSYLKPRQIRRFQFLIPIFHYINPWEKIPTVSLSRERYVIRLFDISWNSCPFLTTQTHISIICFFKSMCNRQYNCTVKPQMYLVELTDILSFCPVEFSLKRSHVNIQSYTPKCNVYNVYVCICVKFCISFLIRHLQSRFC